MKITLPLINPSFDDDRLNSTIRKDIDKGCELFIYKDEQNWKDEEDANVFSLWVKYGYEHENALMFDINLDDLEMFANSILKSIEMFRRDYADDIKRKINDGEFI